MDFAVSAARSAMGKALAPVTDGLLESWAASAELGRNIDALKMELLYAQGMLESAQGREMRNISLKELLHKLQQLAYGADDVLDELEYFRIQDALNGTYHAADAAGLVLNARHTARDVVNKLKFPSSSRVAIHVDSDDDQENDREDDGTQGCLSRVRFCGRRGIGSQPPPPTNEGVKKVDARCMPKVISGARNAAHTIGKQFPCFSSIHVHNDDTQTNVSECGRRFLCNAWPSKARQRDRDIQTQNLTFDRVEMSKKMIDIVEQLRHVCPKVSVILNLDLLGSSGNSKQGISVNRPKTTSEIEEPKLYGRDDQKIKIIVGITGGEYHANELTVLPITGPGGIGKTTFTKHIYQEVKSYFQVSIWICVSLNFNADRLAQEIVKQIPKVGGENENASIEELIHVRLKAKSFLLILDDVWTYDEDEWGKLLAPFKKVDSKGNMVIVTTRIPEVAERVRTTDCQLELESLDPESAMCYFEVCVFGNNTPQPWKVYPGLSGTGKKIVRHLKGSPLATKTVGRLLGNELTSDHWTRVLESKEWELQSSANDIMPALKLSYDFLPFHLKQFFFYCALFPEDYVFDSKELVQLWIGLGILHSYDQNTRIENVGLGYLTELVNYGFFKKEKKEDGCYCYVIHDLLHELATKVSSYECLSICSANVRSIHVPPSVRHLSIIVDDEDVKDRMTFDDYAWDLSALGKRLKVENLHTLMLFGQYHGSFAKTFGYLFREATALRAVFLSGASYSTEDILQNFSKTIHLRYLRIKSADNADDTGLPSMLFRFYHLEVIDLEKWKGRLVSTKDARSLIKLRHFLVPDDKLELHSDMSKVGKLKLLLELRRFEVGKESTGFKLSQLGQLTELGGSLSIYNLEKVQEEKGIKQLKPIHRNHVRKLTLEWDANRINKDPRAEEKVCESLRPHSNLQELCIKGHGGTNCPTWLGENLFVNNLESLHMDDVSWKTFPPFGEFWLVDELGKECQGCTSSQGFHNLKSLELVKIPKLTRWVVSKTSQLFSHLEILIIKDCPELIELPFPCSGTYQPDQGEDMTCFPRLRELKIAECPKLTSMPPIPWTRILRSIEISRTGLRFQNLTYSQETDIQPRLCLKIMGEGGTDSSFWNDLAFCNLSDLRKLAIVSCPPLTLGHIQMLASLEEIVIVDSSIVMSPAEGENHVMYQCPVEGLYISKSGASGKELTQLLSHFPKLKGISINNCEKITELGVMEQQTGSPQQQTEKEEEITAPAEGEGRLLVPTQLQNLIVTGCPQLSIVLNSGGDNNAAAAAGGLQRLRSLQSVYAIDCPKLLSSYVSSSSFFPFPCSLKILFLRKLEGMETLEALSNLTSLTNLEIAFCGDDVRGEGIWPLITQGHLTHISLKYTPNFFVDPTLPCGSSKLRDLSILGPLEPISEEAVPLLTSLQELRCEHSDVQFLGAGLHRLASLKILTIKSCRSMHSLPKVGLPSSLQELHIYNCPAMKSLPKDSLPSSLQKLDISYCPAIKSLPRDGLPSSLKELEICGSGAINSLPKVGLPSSLRVLNVKHADSEELKRECRGLTGYIPIIIA